MRGKGWFWVALESPSLLVRLKTERTELFNSVPVHTLGLTVALTGTHSHFKADGACEEVKYRKQKRHGQRNSVRSKNMKQGKEARFAFLNLWNCSVALSYKDIWSVALTNLAKPQKLGQESTVGHNWWASNDKLQIISNLCGKHSVCQIKKSNTR